MMAIATLAGYSKWGNLTLVARVANKESDYHPLPMRNWTIFIKIELTTYVSNLYQDNLSGSKVIMKQTKTKQLEHLLSKINFAQQQR